MFTANESVLDRVIRGIVGVVLLWLGLGPLHALSGNVWGIIVTVIAVIAIVTAVTGFCLIYRILGISTSKK